MGRSIGTGISKKDARKMDAIARREELGLAAESLDKMSGEFGKLRPLLRRVARKNKLTGDILLRQIVRCSEALTELSDMVKEHM